MAALQQRTALVVVILSLISVASKLLAFVREQVIASRFGVSAVTDAYVAALTVPTLLETVVGGAVIAVLVPMFTAARAGGREQLARLLLTAVACLGTFFALEALVLWAGAPLILSYLVPGLAPAAFAQGVGLARILAPMVALMGLSALFTALLHVHQRFVLPGLAALSANVAIIVAAVVFRDRLTIEQLAAALATGYGVQLVLLLAIAGTARVSRLSGPPDWRTMGQAVVLALPLVAANGVAQTTHLIDRYLASHMSEGSIAALNYAAKLVNLPVNVLILGLSTVLFTRFAQLAVAGEREQLTAMVGRTLQGLIFVMLPAAALLIVLGDAVVAVAFKRGAFDVRAVAATGPALAWYAVGLLPMAALPVLTNVLFALRKTSAQLLAAAAATGAYFVAALALSPAMAHRGLALAYALGQVSAVTVIGLVLARQLGRGAFALAGRSLPVVGLATGAAVLAAWAVSSNLAGDLVRFTLGALAGAGVYLAVHLVFRSDEAGWLLAGVRKARRRLAGLRTHSP